MFGIPFGLTGLGNVWLVLARHDRVPDVIATVIFALAALTWLAALVAYGRYLATDRGALGRDLADPIASPFTALVLITPMLLAAQALHPHAESVARWVVDVLLVLVVLLGGWLTGQWIYGPIGVDQLHPGYFLPTVAGGLLAAYSAAVVGQPRLGWVLFGLGAVCWLVLGSIVLARLLVRPMLPTPLVPTLAIEVAPAAVASIAWFQLRGGGLDTVALALGGYGLLMVLAQVRLLPLFVRLPFAPSTWSFTFSWAAVATAGLLWLEELRPGGYRVWEYVVLVVVTVLVGAVALRTAMALARRQFLPVTPAGSTGGK